MKKKEWHIYKQEEPCKKNQKVKYFFLILKNLNPSDSMVFFGSPDFSRNFLSSLWGNFSLFEEKIVAESVNACGKRLKRFPSNCGKPKGFPSDWEKPVGSIYWIAFHRFFSWASIMTGAYTYNLTPLLYFLITLFVKKFFKKFSIYSIWIIGKWFWSTKHGAPCLIKSHCNYTDIFPM